MHDFQELRQGPSVASLFVVRICAERLDGMDDWLLDEATKIARQEGPLAPAPGERCNNDG